MTDVPIRADGVKNAHVTREVTELLYRWLAEHRLPEARERSVCHHYQEGEFVALSDTGPGRSDRFDELRRVLADDHPENGIAPTRASGCRERGSLNECDGTPVGEYIRM
jgi:hypothetical protein